MLMENLSFEVLRPERHTLGEAAVWCAETHALWWIDVRGPTLLRWTPHNNAFAQWPMPELIGAVVPASNGCVLVSLKDSVQRFDPATGQLTALVTVETGRPHNRLNDAKCDRAGRLWCGSMWDYAKGTSGSLYCVAPDLHVRRVRDDVTIANGIAFAPDSRTMYFVDTATRRIDCAAFDLASGEVGPWRAFNEVDAAPGKPDGTAVDSDGCVWSAQFGGACLARFTPQGKLDRLVALPTTQPTSVAFGGADLGTLFVTTATQWMDAETQQAQPLAGAVLAMQVGVKGLREPVFEKGANV